MLSEYRDRLERSADGLSIAGSSIRWEGDELIVSIDDVEPWTQRSVRGEIRVQAQARFAPEIDLADNGEHRWYPIAPASTAQVRFDRPGLSFDGVAYHDVNQGERALEDDFVEWDWSRLSPVARPGDPEDHSRGLITYDVRTVHAPQSHRRRAFRFGPQGLSQASTTGTRMVDGGAGFWGVSRKPVADDVSRVQFERSFEDSPFYTRGLIRTQIDGTAYRGVHEALRMDRFVHPLVQLMLPFRMRRR